MALKRKIEEKLIEWKNNENHKPLISKGCRQCGPFQLFNLQKKTIKILYI